MPLQKIYFNDVYRRKPSKRMEAEACIASYYEANRLYKDGATYAIIASVPLFL
jgi:hypothetical protein